jgi:hypothetical protein
MKRKITLRIISLLMLPIHLLLDFIQLFIICSSSVNGFTFVSPSSWWCFIFFFSRVCLMKCNLMMDQSQIDGFKSSWEKKAKWRREIKNIIFVCVGRNEKFIVLQWKIFGKGRQLLGWLSCSWLRFPCLLQCVFQRIKNEIMDYGISWVFYSTRARRPSWMLRTNIRYIWILRDIVFYMSRSAFCIIVRETNHSSYFKFINAQFLL